MYGSVLIRGTRFISHHTKILSHSCEIPESLYETISWPPYWDVVSSAVVSPLPTCDHVVISYGWLRKSPVSLNHLIMSYGWLTKSPVADNHVVISYGWDSICQKKIARVPCTLPYNLTSKAAKGIIFLVQKIILLTQILCWIGIHTTFLFYF